ncbi:MAG: Tat (twin-arginine translocation) pathway signal sequence domain protein [Deltaproteobacteria bacterium]|nr:Tat (twin-arginine translocation) pathway signal sequence domain protein [Deltaproteobacteria bacterium]
MFLGGSLASLAACRRAPTIQSRGPRVTHGVQCGDPQTGRAVVWARCDEPARMVVEWSDRRGGARHRVAGPTVTPRTDLTGKVELTGLPGGSDAHQIEYRVRFERQAARGDSPWALGSFATPHHDKFRLAWTGDTCGQGFGRNPEWGGLRGFSAIAAARPDVFVNSGDLIYADNPILAEATLADGRVWRNLTNERVARVAESLDDFRARFAYNLEDDRYRAFAATVPVIAQWDDHETHNNWWPGQELADDRYQRQRDASILASHARTATFEWAPIPRGPVHRVIHYGPLADVFVLDCRSFRSPNSANLGDDVMLGSAQAAWLVDALAASRARWKIMACDQPLGLIIPDDDRQEGFANGDAGPPLGRERELGRVLAAIKARGIKNLVWITADVHYAAAHHFDPARAQTVDFDPFWEFVAGPIHAGTFGPNPLDPTFGPEVRFQWAPPAGKTNLAPWDGYQSFGTIDVTRDALTVILWDLDGHERYRVELPFIS